MQKVKAERWLPVVRVQRRREKHSKKFAISNDNRKLLVYTYNLISKKRYIIALDSEGGREKRFETDGYLRGGAFIDDNTAVFSIRKDRGRNSKNCTLMRVEFAEDGNHEFIPWLQANKACSSVKAAYRGKPVFYSIESEERFILEYGDTKILFSTRLAYIHATKSYIWVIDRNI